VHLDWTINVGTLIAVLTFGFGGLKFYLALRDTLTEIKMLLREFPPHRHEGEYILYPKGIAGGLS